jgi:hypothetical protein
MTCAQGVNAAPSSEVLSRDNGDRAALFFIA